jgi:hypothetical protein
MIFTVQVYRHRDHVSGELPIDQQQEVANA